MLRRWIARLQDLDRLAAEVERARALYEHTRTGQGSEVFRLRYERAVAEFNARKPWWMRAKRPNVRGNLAETAAQEVEKCHRK